MAMGDPERTARHGAVHTACVWEATARKVGNVHRYADYADASYVEFLLSAGVAANVLADAPALTVGESIIATIRATQLVVGSNTNLGIVLLLAPLAKVAGVTFSRHAVRDV